MGEGRDGEAMVEWIGGGGRGEEAHQDTNRLRSVGRSNQAPDQGVMETTVFPRVLAKGVGNFQRRGWLGNQEGLPGRP